MQTVTDPAPLGALRGLLARYRQFLIYAMIGGGAVVIDVGLFWLLAAPFGVAALAANAISVGVAVVYSFLANSFFNFKVWNRLLLRFLSFSVVSFIGFVASSLMLVVLSGVLGMDEVLVKVLSLPVVLLLQFGLNTRVTFAVAPPAGATAVPVPTTVTAQGEPA
jgi:putative flippase GtrA